MSAVRCRASADSRQAGPKRPHTDRAAGRRSISTGEWDGKGLRKQTSLRLCLTQFGDDRNNPTEFGQKKSHSCHRLLPPARADCNFYTDRRPSFPLVHGVQSDTKSATGKRTWNQRNRTGRGTLFHHADRLWRAELGGEPENLGPYAEQGEWHEYMAAATDTVADAADSGACSTAAIRGLSVKSSFR